MTGNNRSTQQQTTNQQQSGTASTSTPGTAWGSNVLSSIDGTSLVGQINAQQGGFTGDRTATMPAPANGFVAQMGPLPSTFVPQRTTADNPFQVAQTHVDPNYSLGITTGIDNANAQAGTLANISNTGLAQWETLLAGPNNPYMADVLASLAAEHNLATNRNQQASAAVWGQQGAFGGSDMARADAFRVGEETRNYDQTVANLQYNNYQNWTDMLAQSPASIAAMAGIGDTTAQRLLTYGGLQQENQAAAAATADRNAQAAANNAWNQGTLTDQNTAASVADDIARWEATYAAEQAATAEGVAQAEWQQGNQQAVNDNDYARWASERDSVSNTLAQLQALLGLSSIVPGGETSSTSTGSGSSTTTTTQQQSPWAVLGSLAGAGLQAFGGGMFGGAGLAASAIPRLGTSASERRLKTGITKLFEDSRGLPWYAFKYEGDPSEEIHTGVMVDEVELIAPHVIVDIGGVKHVDYDMLAGLK